jgi:fructose-1,6-bisphosphatase/sedoheptulose 1,7-bisphosphatase-like protein
MILLLALVPLALDAITGETSVSIQLAIGVGGIILGAAVMRALQGEMQRRHGEDIKELKEWKAQATKQLQEHETHRRVEEAVKEAVQEVVGLEERSASGSTVRGARPKTGSRPRAERT